jgi:hypothetical protein
LIQTIQQWLPLSLYFHNDEPNPRSTLSTTDWDYSDCFQSYLQQALNYQSNGVSVSDWERFEDEQLNIPYQKWQRIMALMLNTLKRGDTLQIQLRGFASPLAASDYNEKLTSRRIQSVKNELSKFDQGALNPYMAHQLVIEELPMGEESSQVALSDDAQNKRESVFSEKARAARRIEIVGIRRMH